MTNKYKPKKNRKTPAETTYVEVRFKFGIMQRVDIELFLTSRKAMLLRA